MWTRQAVAKTIDHAALKPNMTSADVTAACELGLRLGVASVCVRGCDVALAGKLLSGSEVLTSTVLGFPHGSNHRKAKALEAKVAVDEGAVELDMVMSVGQFLSGDEAYVIDDIAGVVAAARPSGGVVKVILETCYLTEEQIRRACVLSEQAGADYVKTSTGFGTAGATTEAVAVMRATVGDRLGIKASGGIKDYATAVGFLEQGCRRLGVGSTEQVLAGAPE